MDFFQWKKDDDGRIVSPLFWVYVVVALALTFVTIGIFWACTPIKRRKTEHELDSMV